MWSKTYLSILLFSTVSVLWGQSPPVGSPSPPQPWCFEPSAFDPHLPSGKTRHYAYFTTMDFYAGQEKQYQLGCRKKGNQTYLASYVDEDEWERGLLASKASCVSDAALAGGQKQTPQIWKWEYSAPDRLGQIFYNAENETCTLASGYCPWTTSPQVSPADPNRPDLLLYQGYTWGPWISKGHVQPYGCEVWNHSTTTTQIYAMATTSQRTYRLLNHSSVITKASDAASLCEAHGGYLGSLGTLADFWQYFNDTEPFYDSGPVYPYPPYFKGKAYQGLMAWMDGTDEDSPGIWKWKYAAPDRANRTFSSASTSSPIDAKCLVEFCNWFYEAPNTSLGSGQAFLMRVSAPPGNTDTLWRISEVVSKQRDSFATSFYVCEFPKPIPPPKASTTQVPSSPPPPITTFAPSLSTTTTVPPSSSTPYPSTSAATTTVVVTTTESPVTKSPHWLPTPNPHGTPPPSPNSSGHEKWLLPLLVSIAVVLIVIVVVICVVLYINRRKHRLQASRDLEQAFIASLNNEDPSGFFHSGSELQEGDEDEGWRRSPLRVDKSPRKSPVTSIRNQEQDSRQPKEESEGVINTNNLEKPVDKAMQLVSPTSTQHTGDLMLKHHRRETGETSSSVPYSMRHDDSVAGSLKSDAVSNYVESNNSSGGLVSTQVSDQTTASSVGHASNPSTTAAPVERTPGSGGVGSGTGKISTTTFKRGKVLGSGAFGKVYLGLDPSTGGLVAAKEVTFSDVSDNNKIEKEMKLLRSEILLMKKLDHPNIVRYLGADRGSDGCSINIFLEYMPGGSLQSIVQNFGAAEPHVAASYIRQAVQGLRYLHSQHVVHRDVKAANMLLDKDGSVKLADFGCSQTVESITSIRGTPLWLAPEVIRQTKADTNGSAVQKDDQSAPDTAGGGQGPPSDIWSIGCVAMELLTGNNPFEWLGNPFNVMRTVASGGEVLEEALSDKNLPEKILENPQAKDFILQCCQFLPGKRPTASQLLYHPWLSQPGGEEDGSSLVSSINSNATKDLLQK